MRLLAVFFVPLVVGPLPAQNLVVNGDFSAGLTGWTETGSAVNPSIDLFDATGFGASLCYACNPQTTGNAIGRGILIQPGIPLEFTADFAVDKSTLVSNVDAGRFWVTVGDVEILRLSLGSFQAGFPQRGRLAARFTHPVGGQVPLRIHFQRGFQATPDTPRSRIDNVTLRVAAGPTFDMVGNRKIGLARTVRALSDPSQAVVFFLSPQRMPRGAPLRGVNGIWYLGGAGLVVFFAGTTDGQGVHAFNCQLPADPALTWAPVFVQGLKITAVPEVYLGFDQFLTFVP